MLQGATLLPGTSVPAQWLSSADNHEAAVPFCSTALSPGPRSPWEGAWEGPWEGPGSLRSLPSLPLTVWLVSVVGEE